MAGQTVRRVKIDGNTYTLKEKDGQWRIYKLVNGHRDLMFTLEADVDPKLLKKICRLV